MTDRPIIFSAPMVAALLAGRKTQTRRLASSPLRKCVAGDRLYVRERCYVLGKWRKDGLNDAGRQRWRFVANETRRVTFDPEHPDIGTKDTPRDQVAFWSRPSIHQPRWASRLTLTIIRVRTQPLVCITEHDALDEGIIEYGATDEDDAEYAYREGGDIFSSARDAFRYLWGSLHGPEAWAENPDVVALTFEVAQGNIDGCPPPPPVRSSRPSASPTPPRRA